MAFDDRADRYDASRPRFTAQVVERLMASAELRPGDRVVEVGAGTGQLTEALLEADLRVVAVEPGPNMAALLANRFGDRARFRDALPGVDRLDVANHVYLEVARRLDSRPSGGRTDPDEHGSHEKQRKD